MIRRPLRFSRLVCLVLTFVACAPLLAPPHGNAEESLDRKIGQMLMVGFRGTTAGPDSPIIADIKNRSIGGVILFDYDIPSRSPVRNITSPEQLAQLTASLQKAADIPLFIAVDQEGGRVARLKECRGFPPTPSQKTLGEQGETATRRAAIVTADTLSAAGINVNFAPVVDLDRNPSNPVIGMLERSFSDDSSLVIRLAREMVDAFHSRGVLSAIKHFPGHGSAQDDSHLGFVDVTNTWSQEELAPFATLVRDGACDMVMTAHITQRSIDPRWPATLSVPMISGILRRQIGFDGVVISDDMQMKAIRACFGEKEAVRQALLAGVDILLFANNSVFEEDTAVRIIRLIKELVMEGAITEERIDESWQRIMKLKESLAASGGRTPHIQ